MRSNPGGIRFAEACKVATHYFGKPRHEGTSHKVWKMPWPGDPRINMQEGDGGKAKSYQVRQAIAAIDRFLSPPKVEAKKNEPETRTTMQAKPPKQKRR